jgi:hypothetical protein
MAHALAFEDHRASRSHQRILRPDVFLPSSLGEGFRAMVISL